jgi:hypothetical protein
MFFCTASQWILLEPKHVKVDILYNICCVDRFFLGFIDRKHNRDKSPSDKRSFFSSILFPKYVFDKCRDNKIYK